MPLRKHQKNFNTTSGYALLTTARVVFIIIRWGGVACSPMATELAAAGVIGNHLCIGVWRWIGVFATGGAPLYVELLILLLGHQPQ